MKIILIVLFCATAAFAGGYPRDAPSTTTAAPTTAAAASKPGKCPVPRFFARPICNGDQDDECKHDSDCSDDAKCCFNSCGYECMPPVNKPKDTPIVTAAPTTVAPTTVAPTTVAPTTVAPTTAAATTAAATTAAATTAAATTKARRDAPKPKPGKCPDRRYFARPICNGDQDDECKYDDDCKDEAKCCNNGCGYECMAPVKPQPKDAPTTAAPTTVAATTAAATTAAASTAKPKSCKNVLCSYCERCDNGQCVKDANSWLCKNKRYPCAGFNCPASRECKLRDGRPECVDKVPKGKGYHKGWDKSKGDD